jgi:3-deoxy-D-manno-octulosonic-acid transferase
VACRSARRFVRFRGFSGPIFALLDAVFVQEPEEGPLWETLGANSSAIHGCGSIKYDEPPTNSPLNADLELVLRDCGVAPERPILLAGSTFPGEEIALARVFGELRKTFPELFLIVVPRHVERTPEIVAALASLNLKIALRTEPQSAQADLLLVNTTGELRDWYAFATVVFIGKSLTSAGGQNPVEPALLGKPVVFGPHMENFAPIVRQWLATEAAIQVANEAELAGQIGKLLADADLRTQLTTRALAAIGQHFGATARVVARLQSSVR